MPVLPEYELTGQVALFATSGGEEAPFLAGALAEAGAAVFAVARTQKLLDAVLERAALRQFGGGDECRLRCERRPRSGRIG